MATGNNQASVLKSFLVAIGFKVDDVSYKKFKNQLATATEQVVDFGAVATLASIAFGKGILSMADDLEKLYFATQRTGAGVASLRGLALGAENAGVSAETARAAVESLAMTLRNPGMTQLLQGFGIKIDKDQTKTLFNLVDKLKGLGTSGPGWALAQQIAGQFGIDPKTLLMLEKNEKEFQEGFNTVADAAKRAGINYEELEKNSHEFNKSVRGLKTKWQVIEDLVLARMLPVGNKLVWLFDKMANGLIWLDKKTNGWSTTIGAPVAAIAGGFGIQFLLKQLLGSIGLGAGSAAAGGAASGGVGSLLGTLLPIIIPIVLLAGLAYLATSKSAAEYVRKALGLPEHIGKAEIKHGVVAVANFVDKHTGGKLTEAAQKVTPAIMPYIAAATATTKKVVADVFDLYKFIAHNEAGLKPALKKYWDRKGYSIGYGHFIQAGENFDKGITASDALQLLFKDVDKSKGLVAKLLHGKANSAQLAAFTDFAFNIGGGNFASSTALKEFNLGHIEAAARAMGRFDLARDKQGTLVYNEGLHARRQKEADMLAGHHIEIESHNTFNIASNDPHAVADHVSQKQAKTNGDLLRNARGAIN
jgi:GH24 family phage-related lysozyme (muramidase)